MEAVITADGASVNYQGLSFEFAPDGLPATAVAQAITSVLGNAFSGINATFEITDTGAMLSGTSDSGDYILSIDPETSAPIKLSIPAENLEIEFDNFQFLDK
jgi:hypothetical protein